MGVLARSVCYVCDWVGPDACAANVGGLSSFGD